MISDFHMFLSADIIIYLKITKKGDRKNSEMDTPEERLRRRRETLSSCTRSVTSHPVPPSCSQSSLLKHEEQYSSLDKKRKKFHIQALTLLLSAHFFSLSSGPWQTLNHLWKVLGTTFPRIWKKISAMPFKFQVLVIYCWLARILVQVFWRAVWQYTSKSSRTVHFIWSNKPSSEKLT